MTQSSALTNRQIARATLVVLLGFFASGVLGLLRTGIIAGAFGSYLDISSTLSIGMFPPIPLNRFRQVGNAAGAGAKGVLISKSMREDIKGRVMDIRYIELAGAEGFNRTYMQAINIG